MFINLIGQIWFLEAFLFFWGQLFILFFHLRLFDGVHL